MNFVLDNFRRTHVKLREKQHKQKGWDEKGEKSKKTEKYTPILF